MAWDSRESKFKAKVFDVPGGMFLISLFPMVCQLNWAPHLLKTRLCAASGLEAMRDG